MSWITLDVQQPSPLPTICTALVLLAINGLYPWISTRDIGLQHAYQHAQRWRTRRIELARRGYVNRMKSPVEYLGLVGLLLGYCWTTPTHRSEESHHGLNTSQARLWKSGLFPVLAMIDHTCPLSSTLVQSSQHGSPDTFTIGVVDQVYDPLPASIRCGAPVKVPVWQSFWSLSMSSLCRLSFLAWLFGARSWRLLYYSTLVAFIVLLAGAAIFWRDLNVEINVAVHHQAILSAVSLHQREGDRETQAASLRDSKSSTTPFANCQVRSASPRVGHAFIEVPILSSWGGFLVIPLNILGATAATVLPGDFMSLERLLGACAAYFAGAYLLNVYALWLIFVLSMVPYLAFVRQPVDGDYWLYRRNSIWVGLWYACVLRMSL